MPALANYRREAFVQGLFAGLGSEAAFAAAGFRPHRQNAHRLMTSEDIATRLAELRKPSVTAVMFSREDRLAILAGIALDTANDPKARISAIAEVNKMTGGHAASRVEVKHTYADLSDAELGAELRRLEAAATLLH